MLTLELNLDVGVGGREKHDRTVTRNERNKFYRAFLAAWLEQQVAVTFCASPLVGGLSGHQVQRQNW